MRTTLCQNGTVQKRRSLARFLPSIQKIHHHSLFPPALVFKGLPLSWLDEFCLKQHRFCLYLWHGKYFGTGFYDADTGFVFVLLG
jgi:hypothetical protein